MRKPTFIFLLFVTIILVSVVFIGKYLGVISPAQTILPIPQSSQTVTTQEPLQSSAAWKLEEVARGLFVPWSIVFTSPTRILVTERNGNIRVIDNGKLLPTPIHTFSRVKNVQEEGLMGMTVDPNYSENKYVYIVYAYPNGNAYTDTVVRLIDDGSSFTNETVLLDGIPAAKYHAGSRLQFGPDGKLYITTGDATDKKNPQDIASLGGKILRINADGSFPTDNPFPNSPVWSFGHRNPQGITWNFQTGTMYETEHGPSGNDGPLGGDEVNIIEKKSNYGWPTVSHTKHADGMIDPLIVFTPAIAPAGALYYTGTVFPQWKDHLLFGMLKGEGIMNVTFDQNNPKQVLSFDKIKDISVGRIRDVVAAPSGEIYFSTSNDDGRGNTRNGDDKIYKITRAN